MGPVMLLLSATARTTPGLAERVCAVGGYIHCTLYMAYHMSLYMYLLSATEWPTR